MPSKQTAQLDESKLSRPLVVTAATSDPVYIESWKKGSTTVRKRTIRISLTDSKPKFETSLIDSNGRKRYVLSILPDNTDGLAPVYSWGVNLVEVGDKSGANLLCRTNDREQDYFTAGDYVWWLDPSEDPKPFVPFLAKRVVKVEGFYCVIRVQDYKLTANQKAVESISVLVQFTNRSPLTPTLTSRRKN